MAVLLLSLPVARAGTYSRPVYSGGQVTITSPDGSSGTYPYVEMSDGYGNNRDGQGSSVACAGTITATFTWQPAPRLNMTTDPPPTSVILREMAGASASASMSPAAPVPGSCDNGRSVTQSPLIQTQSQGVTTGTGNCYSDHSSIIAGGATVTLMCSPNASASGNRNDAKADVRYLPSLVPITIDLSNSVIVGGVPEALTGQAIAASMTPLPSTVTLPSGAVINVPPNGTPSNYRWVIESADGASIVGGYIAQQALGMTKPIASLSSPTVTFYDGIQDTATVNLTVTITFPDHTFADATATTHLLFVKPTVISHSFGIVHYDNFAQHPNDTNSLLGATESWSTVVIGMPPGFSGGTGCFTQTLQSTSRADTRHTGTDYTIQNKLSNGQWVAIPAPCLDTDFPYPYATSWTVGASGINGQGMGGDQPSFNVAPALNSGDFGMPDWYSATGNDKFLTWIMYNPNQNATNSIWVPLASFDWGWSNTASLNTSIIPNAWQSGTFSGNVASNLAPTGVWPTWNTWIPYNVINNNQTGTVAMHMKP